MRVGIPVIEGVEVSWCNAEYFCHFGEMLVCVMWKSVVRERMRDSGVEVHEKKWREREKSEAKREKKKERKRG